MLKYIIDYYKRNKSKFRIIFWVLIPILVGITGATMGYDNKEFLGAIAGFFRFGFYYYLALIITCVLFYAIYEYWTFLLSLLFLIAIGGFILCIIWIFNKLSWFFNNY